MTSITQRRHKVTKRQLPTSRHGNDATTICLTPTPTHERTCRPRAAPPSDISLSASLRRSASAWRTPFRASGLSAAGTSRRRSGDEDADLPLAAKRRPPRDPAGERQSRGNSASLAEIMGFLRFSRPAREARGRRRQRPRARLRYVAYRSHAGDRCVAPVSNQRRRASCGPTHRFRRPAEANQVAC